MCWSHTVSECDDLLFASNAASELSNIFAKSGEIVKPEFMCKCAVYDIPALVASILSIQNYTLVYAKF